jgi:hypothetical protein
MGRWLILLPDFLINLSAGYFFAATAVPFTSEKQIIGKIYIFLLNLAFAIIVYVLAIKAKLIIKTKKYERLR